MAYAALPYWAYSQSKLLGKVVSSLYCVDRDCTFIQDKPHIGTRKEKKRGAVTQTGTGGGRFQEGGTLD